MPKIISDKFSKLKISRQRKWQLRRKAAGLCVRCGDKAVVGDHCLKHAIAKRERARKQFGCKRKNNSLTSRIQKQVADAKKVW